MKQITIRFTFSKNQNEEEFISSLDGWINDFMDTDMADSMLYEVVEEED